MQTILYRGKELELEEGGSAGSFQILDETNAKGYNLVDTGGIDYGRGIYLVANYAARVILKVPGQLAWSGVGAREYIPAQVILASVRPESSYRTGVQMKPIYTYMGTYTKAAQEYFTYLCQEF